MANITLVGLTDLTGVFPGASNDTTDTTIPNIALTYKGQEGNYWQPEADGSAPGAVTAGGVGADTTNFDAQGAGMGVEFIRAVHETVVQWNDTALTGTNAVKYFGAKVGNFSISDQTALKRTFSTDLYYELNEELGGPDANTAA